MGLAQPGPVTGLNLAPDCKSKLLSQIQMWPTYEGAKQILDFIVSNQRKLVVHAAPKAGFSSQTLNLNSPKKKQTCTLTVKGPQHLYLGLLGADSPP